MRTFFNFNKNTGALAVLLCCFFFNLSEGKAQFISNLVSPKGTNVKIIWEGEAICGQQPAGKLINLTSSVNLDFKKVDLLAAMADIPKSQYYKIRKNGVGNPVLTIQVTSANPAFSNNNINWNGNSFFIGAAGTKSPNNPFGGNWPYEQILGYDQSYKFPGGIGQRYEMGGWQNSGAWPRADEVGYAVFFFSYFKIDNSWSDHFAFVLPFVIEGTVDESVPVLGTTVQPQIPYMVLHAPPGDGSSSEFQETKTSCREFTDTYAQDGSNSANLDVKLGVAGTIGFIATVDYEFSVTFSAGITTGDLAVTTKSNQTCVTVNKGFSTSKLLGGSGSGDVFIGYGTDLDYGIYRSVRTNPNTCVAYLDTSLIYTPSGAPRKFAYTEDAIQAEILVQKAIADNPANNARARNNAQNQADVWEKVLAQNIANKNNPNNAFIENLSFSAGANGNQESSVTVLETNSLDVEHYVDFNTGISSVVEIGGSGVSGGYEYKGSYRYGKTNSSSAETTKVVHYTLADDDPGDLFNVTVVRDPMYGTPVFRVGPTSKTSCPYEGGYQRDQPKVKHNGTTDDHIVSQGNPVGSSATFKLDLCNESNYEARTYNLKLNAQSNLNGAVVSAAGVPLNGNDLGQTFTIPANSCVQDLIVEVKQLSAASPLEYPNLELFLYSPCEDGIQSSVFASVYFGNATGVNELADNSLLSVSPNPTFGLLQISLPEDKTLESIRVIDLSGKTVRDLTLNAASSNAAIDLSGLPKGMYALQARSEGQVLVKKVVIE